MSDNNSNFPKGKTYTDKKHPGTLWLYKEVKENNE